MDEAKQMQELFAKQAARDGEARLEEVKGHFLARLGVISYYLERYAKTESLSEKADILEYAIHDVSANSGCRLDTLAKSIATLRQLSQ